MLLDDVGAKLPAIKESTEGLERGEGVENYKGYQLKRGDKAHLWMRNL